MPDISHAAKFNPAQAPAGILDDLACPACGREDPGDAPRAIVDNKLRVFCDDCGAFITISLSDEQADALRRWSPVLTTGGDGVPGRRREAASP